MSQWQCTHTLLPTLIAVQRGCRREFVKILEKTIAVKLRCLSTVPGVIYLCLQWSKMAKYSTDLIVNLWYIIAMYQLWNINGWPYSYCVAIEDHVEKLIYYYFLFRYKYYNFYDLNPKYDGSRINQIYEQAR